MADLQATIEEVARESHGRIMATLAARFGDFDLAEDALQDAFAIALQRWPQDGIPRNPPGWITTAALRLAHNRVRRDQVRSAKYALIATEAREDTSALDRADEWMFPDERLRLMFTCCHPALNHDAQIALTLRMLGGLSTRAIARAFLLPEATLAQRLVRAKRKIHEARIPYRVPDAEQLPGRLSAVLVVLYAIFNEGYRASTGDALIRDDLCAEAIRLGRALCELLPGEPESVGLLALMLLHQARRPARTTLEGLPLPLDAQDHTRWNQSLIAEGGALLDRALAQRRPGPYQIQAAIAALHTQAPSPDETDWPQIVGLYVALWSSTPSPVVELNLAAAVAMAYDPEQGLQILEQPHLARALSDYRWFHATRADLLGRLSRMGEARDAYAQALTLAEQPAEQAFLRQRAAELSGGGLFGSTYVAVEHSGKGAWSDD